MFITKNRVRLHDVDIAGRLYFPRQFRFVHEALEDFMESEGKPFSVVFLEEDYLFVIVHCEADYHRVLTMGDDIEVHVYCENIGESSFTLCYNIYLANGEKTGTAKTVHVSLEKSSGKKIPNPPAVKEILSKHLVD